MRAPASTGTNKLPTLEDNSQTSNSAHTSQGHNSKSYNSQSHNSSRDGSNNSHSGEGSSTNKPRGMKRSPYLSVMAGSTKESEDLVALLSRPRSNSSAKKLDEILPSGHGHGGGIKEGIKEGSTGASVLMEKMNVDDNDEQMGRGELIGVGGVIGNKGLSHGVNLSTTNQQQSQPGSDVFFNLKRPSNKPPPTSSGGGFELSRNKSSTPSVTPVSSGGTEFTNAEYDEGSGSGSASNQGSGSGDARMKPPPQQPSTNNRSLGIGPQLKSALRIGGSRTNLQESNTPSTSNNMGRSNVSFSNTTKMASTKGLTTFPDNIDGNKYGNATFNFGTNTGGSVQAKQVAQMRQFQIGGGGSSGGQGMGGAKYSAQNMMRKSQSIAAPQFMLTHTQSIGSKSGTGTTIDSRGNSSSANESFNIASSSGQSVATTTTGNSGGSGGSGEVVGQSFPIFLGKLSTPSDKQQQQSQQQSQQQQNLQKHVRQRSQSTTTLKYYASHNQNTSCIQKDPAQQLLQAAGMTGIATTRTSTLNLTFRDMLDEGDGTENDLNSRLRNQQWKDFSNFSNQFEKSNPMLRSVDEQSSTGSKDSSMGECSSASTSGAGRRKSSMGSQMSLSGSKRSIGSGGSSGGASGGSNSNSRGNQQWQRPYGLAGSHRQAVSVNDLAVLRRAASRMKMNNVTGGGGGMASMGGSSMGSQQKLPGETLGGSLLSRINSTADSSIGGSSHSGTATNTPPTTILSPMEQMMARKQSQQTTTQQQPQTSEMFMKQFNLAMSSGPGQYSVQPSPSTVYNTTSSSGASMGRQVRSVGAGLAYGRVNMTTNANRLSRFNLGNMNRTNSRLSEISSAGSSSSRTGIGTPRGNEEWDLG